MRRCFPKKDGQAAMEYMILLGLMTVIALTAFRTLIPGAHRETNLRFDVAVANIAGNAAKTSLSGPWPMGDPAP